MCRSCGLKRLVVLSVFDAIMLSKTPSFEKQAARAKPDCSVSVGSIESQFLKYFALKGERNCDGLYSLIKNANVTFKTAPKAFKFHLRVCMRALHGL